MTMMPLVRADASAAAAVAAARVSIPQIRPLRLLIVFLLLLLLLWFLNRFQVIANLCISEAKLVSGIHLPLPAEMQVVSSFDQYFRRCLFLIPFLNFAESTYPDQ